MNQKKQIIGAAVLSLAASSAWAGGWMLEQRTDALSDEKFMTAFTAEESAGFPSKVLAIRCRGGDLEVFVRFQKYLGDRQIRVISRVDRDRPRNEEWDAWAAASGTVLYVPNAVPMTRDLVKGSSFIVEATDYRGVVHRATFSLAEAEPKITAVMKQCDVGWPASQHWRKEEAE